MRTMMVSGKFILTKIASVPQYISMKRNNGNSEENGKLKLQSWI